jgi:hypothetical protein
MQVKTNLDLSRYSANELLILLDHGIISVSEFGQEMSYRVAGGKLVEESQKEAIL